MRCSVGGLLLIVSLSALAADGPVRLESRSQHHALIVDVKPDAHYDVRVVDLQTHEVLFSREIAGMPAEGSADLRDLHITVRVGAAPYGITTTVVIEQGDTVIDSLHTAFTLTSHRAHLHAPGALRVGGDVKAPVVIRRVEPMYTDEARRDRVSGIVIVEALVDKSGVVKDAIVLKPLPFGLSDAALDAVKQWQFQPATQNGAPVDVVFNLTIDFRIDR